MVAAAKLHKVKEQVLGKRYELSVAFVSSTQMRKAMRYKKNPAVATSNVLAFPLSKTSGEILICKAATKPFTPEFLFIHGLLHLKGLKHGCIMEREEGKLLKRFGLSRTTHG